MCNDIFGNQNLNHSGSRPKGWRPIGVGGLDMKIFIKKYLGDDKYSWAVFVNGVPKWTGLSKASAQAMKKREQENTK